MNVKKIAFYLFTCMFLATTNSCSDNNEQPGVTVNESYVFGSDDGSVSCDHLLFNAQGKEDNTANYIGNGEQNFVFNGVQTLKKGTYVLKGWVYIADGATLTIEPGTIIRGDKTTKAAIIVERGGRLVAQGSAQEPIVFTSNQAKGSRKPGDWGGLIICGKAPNNQNNDQLIEGGPRSHHGGTNTQDNSGILSYVRVEFAGYPFEKNKEINGITFGSVGSKTQIDHVQVSYSNDDSFEWFGGSVDCKYLIAYKGWDDDFDTDNGFCGKVQFGLAIRDPKIADMSLSNGFESDNCGDGSAISPFTTATFSNMTFVGPLAYTGFQNTNDYINGGEYNPNNGATLGLFQSAMQIRRSSRLSCFNSVAIGFPIGLIIDGEKGSTVTAAKEGLLKLQNVWFAGMGIVGADGNNRFEDVLYDAANKVVLDANQVSYSHSFFTSQKGNAVKTINELSFSDPLSIGVNFMPTASSSVIGAADFSDSMLSGFDTVNYIGALSAGDSWLSGWTNFNPNNTEY